MSKTKTARKTEQDSIYVLKLVVYLIVGSFWVRLTHGNFDIPLPVGFGVGLVLAMHDHFKTDRRIEYAVLLIAMFVGFFAQVGLSILL